MSLDHTGHPILSKLRDCYLDAVTQGRQGQIPLFVGGGFGDTGDLAADAFKAICLGANGVFAAKIFLQLAGCVGNEKGRCNACNTGKCPVGITTQDPRLVARLDVDAVAQNVVDYFLALDAELKKLMAPIGNSSLPVGRSDALVSLNKPSPTGCRSRMRANPFSMERQDMAIDTATIHSGINALDRGFAGHPAGRQCRLAG